MSAGTQPTRIELAEAVPIERFYRLDVGQYRRMIEAGILVPHDRVELREGLICRQAPRSHDLPERLYRLSVDQYHEMVRLGILAEDDRVELLEGWLIAGMTINPSHRISTHRVRVALERAMPDGWYVDHQNPITVEDSEPEPDISVVRGDTGDYRDRHPGPHDVAMVVEVSDASLADDRTFKKELYARAQLSIYWIVNLRDRCIEVYTEPSGPANPPDYRQRRDYGPEDAVPVVIEGREVGRLAVAEWLP